MKSDNLIQKAIDDFSMIEKNQSVLVGFSGGSDSVCLLNFLYEHGYKVSAAHLNHNMRDTAERDMFFCRKFCEERDITLFEHTEIKGRLKNELDARRARYNFFNRVAEENGIDLIATAHNKNDVAETVLLHMLRGASTEGLGGIAPVSGNLIRPIIYLKKCDVYAYIKAKGLSYMTDETNLTDAYSRNKLRNSIIPILEKEFNPGLVDVLADNSLLIAADADYINRVFKNTYSSVAGRSSIELSVIRSEHTAISGRILQKMWKSASGAEQNLSAGYISDIQRLITRNRNGSSIDLPLGVTAYIEYGKLTVVKKRKAVGFYINAELERSYNPVGGITLKLTKNGKGAYVYLCDNDEIVIRNKKDGDRFYPKGMVGSKKLSDYFTDMHIAKSKRDSIPVLEVNKEIAAICGYRTDRRFSENRGMGEKYYIEIIYNN